jgi:hypothetical protein
MRLPALCFTLVSTIAINIAASLPAQAQRARVFVSVTGNDANPCTAGSPCKTFQAAHDAVLTGGEISVLDTGGYGTLIINKAVSIVADGVEASIAIPSGVTGITVNAGSTDKVSLRGLTLDGTTIGHSGILFNTGQSLTVEKCVVRNMTASGLIFVSTSGTLQTLAVSDSYFNDNGGGIDIETGSGSITASIDRTGLHGNANGGLAVQGSFGTGAVNVAVTDSVADNNGAGFFVASLSGASISNLSLTHVQAAGNIVGVQSNGTNATLWLAQSTVTGSVNHGFSAINGGVINSYSDNYLQANGTNAGTLTSATKQ